MSGFFKSVDHDPIDFIGRYKATDLDVAHVASYLHELLGLSVDWARTGTFEDAVRRMRHAIESRRVSVSVSGYCRNATHRGFDVQEFRGFVLCDDYASMIFVNGKDAKVVQIFTMVHEMTHLLLAQTGLVGGEDPETVGAEEFCDKVTAEFLLPASEFVLAWDCGGKDRKRVMEAIQKRFKVSFATVARRALELNLVSRDEYRRLCRDHYEGLDEHAHSHSDGGGNSYNNLGSKLGIVFMEAIYIAVKSDALAYSDAYKLTGLKAKTFSELSRRKNLVL